MPIQPAPIPPPPPVEPPVPVAPKPSPGVITTPGTPAFLGETHPAGTPSSDALPRQPSWLDRLIGWLKRHF